MQVQALNDITKRFDIDVSSSGGGESGGGGSGGDFAGLVDGTITQAYDSTVTSVRMGAFAGLSLLESVSFPACETVNNYAFQGCTALTDVSLPTCENISGFAFSGCTSLENIIIPACGSIGVSAFYDCTNLKTVSLPECKTIGSVAFANCYNLLSVYLLGSTYASLESLAFMSTPIDGYTASTSGVYGSIYVPASMISTYQSKNNWSTYSSRFVVYDE